MKQRLAHKVRSKGKEGKKLLGGDGASDGEPVKKDKRFGVKRNSRGE